MSLSNVLAPFGEILRTVSPDFAREASAREDEAGREELAYEAELGYYKERISEAIAGRAPSKFPWRVRHGVEEDYDVAAELMSHLTDEQLMMLARTRLVDAPLDGRAATEAKLLADAALQGAINEMAAFLAREAIEAGVHHG